jgi:hypothetical protein
MRDEPAQPRSLNAKLAATADAESTSLILVCIITALSQLGSRLSNRPLTKSIKWYCGGRRLAPVRVRIWECCLL